jgi:AraC family L-rhamnose operon transcriptional activator RhaR
VAVADRYPQNVFAEHTHEFCELVLVWRGNGLHVLNDRPGALPAAICSIFAPKINTPTPRLTIWSCKTSSIARSGCGLTLTGRGDSRPVRHAVEAALAHGQQRYGAGRQVITQLEHESSRSDAQANAMAELLFAQLALTSAPSLRDR